MTSRYLEPGYEDLKAWSEKIVRCSIFATDCLIRVGWRVGLPLSKQPDSQAMVKRHEHQEPCPAMSSVEQRSVPSAAEYAQPLFLTPHAFLAQAGSVLIFLDLRDDSYISLEEKFTRPIGARLGIPLAGNDDVHREEASADEVRTLIADLHEARLLAVDPGEGKPALLLSHPADIRELPRFGIGGPAVRARHVAIFAAAFLKARVMLRFGHIERTARRVARRRETQWRPRDVEGVRELVEIFRKVRPLFMGRRDRCLLDALTLIEFLARFGVYPSWNFGVRTNEFLAHCWVQDGNLVYDDDLENICDYNVIMRA